MSDRKPLDWSKTGTCAAMAKWLRESSDAICVLVIRPNDSVFSVDPKCKAEDAQQLVTDYIPRLAERVDLARQEKKPAARLELGPSPE